MTGDINYGLLLLHGNRSRGLSAWSSYNDLLAPSDAQGMRGLQATGPARIVQQITEQGAT
jgi:hypothetical protein